jgi:hypothetical protein
MGGRFGPEYTQDIDAAERAAGFEFDVLSVKVHGCLCFQSIRRIQES